MIKTVVSNHNTISETMYQQIISQISLSEKEQFKIKNTYYLTIDESTYCSM